MVCWCLSWLQNPDPIVASEREEPRPIAKPRGIEASWYQSSKLNKGRPGGYNEAGRGYKASVLRTKTRSGFGRGCRYSGRGNPLVTSQRKGTGRGAR
ncbi:hypothetical protein E2C01_043875 [Portunus trituberculatus]|uniref:Uncharacterized protein n=1 Tax=Portunus trituberculatus TaxID=210409 RepID=A0A5B7G0P4_PORTR|nr:hypothetical protein [Portunus trituberculatus]